MAKTLEGMVVFAIYESASTFNYTDPSTGQTRPLRSVRVRMPHGDGIVSRESLSLPQGYDLPDLKPEQTYWFPVVASVSKKGKLSLTLRLDLKPFVAPAM